MRKSILRAPPARRQTHPRRPNPFGPHQDQDPIMDIERINAIGNHIADLSERTTALRGYL
jgi:hypothetical protein